MLKHLTISILTLMLFAQFSAALAAGDGISGDYKKKNGVVVARLIDGDVYFIANSVVGMHPCNIGENDDPKIAKLVDEHRAVWTSEDNEDKCVVLLNFSGNTLKVTTKDCHGYCGVDAAGSLDGIYTKKRK